MTAPNRPAIVTSAWILAGVTITLAGISTGLALANGFDLRTVDYLLFVTASDGRSEQVGSWTSLSGATMEVPAATSVPRDDIASVEVRTTSGRVVLRLDA